MTIANSFAAKASVAFVAIAMALSMVAPAQAQTAEELQAQIDTLMATIASLQGQLGASSATSANAYVFTRALTIGSTGADVTALQNYLIGAGFSIPAGATGYFGTQTQAAVAAWQAANGVAPAAGYFGPISQAKYNALMAAMPSTPSDDDDDDATDDDDDFELSGQASLGDADLSDGDDTDVEEGQEAAPVAEFEVEFTDGDAQITRIDLNFDATSNGGDEEDPWDTFEEISLWVDGDEVASKAADDEDDWLNDEETIRFAGLDIIGMEDEPLTIVIAVTVQGSVDDLAATWEVDVTGMRYVDADGVNTTEDNAGVGVNPVDFEINEAGSDDEVIIKTSTEDPDASTLQVEQNSNSDLMTIFAFDIDTDDSTNDIEFDTIRVGLQSGTENVEDIINDLVLVIDGEEFDDWSWVTNGTDTAVEVDFDIDGDLTIDAGDRVTAELQAEFKKLDTNYAGGETITATTTEDGWEAEGADDIDVDGSASGETHTLRVIGINVENPTKSATVTTVDGATNDYATFTLEFDVTAFEEDIYIGTNPATSTVYEVQDAGGNDLSGTGTTTAVLDSSADENGAGTFFIVREGETEEFTLEVTYLPGVANQAARLQLVSLKFDDNDTDPTPDETWTATPASSYRTSTKTIVN